MFKQLRVNDAWMKRMRLNLQFMVGSKLFNRLCEQNLGQFTFVVGVCWVVEISESLN